MADPTFTPAKRRKLNTACTVGGDIPTRNKDLAADATEAIVFPETPTSDRTLDEPEQQDEPYSVRELSHVQIPRPCLPDVAFTSWDQREAVSEFKALFDLANSLDGYIQNEDGNQYLELENFSIYRAPVGKRAMDLCMLDRLQTGRGVDCLCFSGTLSNGKAKIFVKDVTFETLAIDGYGDCNCYTMSDKVCIQSRRAGLNKLWYRLRRPSAEYEGFYRPFLWLATFTKFFVDFLDAYKGENVTLGFFRSNFKSWLITQYGSHSLFQSWHIQCDSQKDFGTSAAAFANFLYKECYSIDDSESRLLQQPIWREIDPLNLNAIKRQPSLPLAVEMTVVTPFVYKCFKDMYFASHLSLKEPTPEVLDSIKTVKREKCLTPWNASPTVKPLIDLNFPEQASIQDPRDVRQGDVVCIEPNGERDWIHSRTTMWYAYVQNVHQDQRGKDKLDVIWLYEAADTTIGNAFYPFKNELFFSDNCSCGTDAIPLTAVVTKLGISWFTSDPEAVPGYFVRQKFHTSEHDDSYAFTTLHSEDFSCSAYHNTEFEHCLQKYKPGQTVLVLPQCYSSDDLLQPMRIISIDVATQRILLRKLLRKSVGDHEAPLNELYESTAEPDILRLSAHRIVRRCKVERFTRRSEVRSPFNHGGAGDHFYILEEGSTISSQSTLATPPESDDGNDAEPSQRQRRPLTGLDLFCGGGNFGRGLEEAGITQMKYAVDWDAAALHSYRANVKDPNEVQYFLGSVNDYLRRALHGSKNSLIALIGGVGLISAGSPCPGFSNMQPDKQSHQSLQFASMVASVVAFVDCYCPQYFVLENVVPMTSKIVVNGREQNVFSQIISSLVALGYQVQQFLGDAWSVGSSQQRSRVFIVASAPGTTPLLPPPRTHGHHNGKRIMTTLGKTSNGLAFGIRRFEPTPFPGVTAQSATADLPDIGDSMPQICPQFPDHRTAADESLNMRQRIARVPIHPYGMGLQKAVQNGDITSGEAYEWIKRCKGQRALKGSRSYTRVSPNGLFPTIMTALRLQCAFNGRVVHWEQHRSLSIMETRRAQGFLDHEVIVGVPSQQLKIVGNSVDRKVAFAIGLAIKYSWDATLKQRDDLLHGVQIIDEETIEQTRDLPHTLPAPARDTAPVRSEHEQQEAERSKRFREILRDLLEHNKPISGDLESMESGQRWSGDSPADAIKVRRRMSELESFARD